MDFGLSFGYVFEDKDWFRKIAIPALVSLIPIIGQFIVTGWGLKATGSNRLYPEWVKRTILLKPCMPR